MHIYLQTGDRASKMITTHVQCTHIVGQEPSSWQNRQTTCQSACPWSGKLRFKDEECFLSAAFHFFTRDRSVGQGKGLISRCQLYGQHMGNKVFSSRVRLAKRAPSLLELSVQLYVWLCRKSKGTASHNTIECQWDFFIALSWKGNETDELREEKYILQNLRNTVYWMREIQFTKSQKYICKTNFQSCQGF